MFYIHIFNPPFIHRIGIILKAHRKLSVAIACIIATAMLITFIGVQTQTAVLRNSSEYVKLMDYYVTESGDKYHKEDCRVIQGKNNVRRITEEEFASEKYEPCKICKP